MALEFNQGLSGLLTVQDGNWGSVDSVGNWGSVVGRGRLVGWGSVVVGLNGNSWGQNNTSTGTAFTANGKHLLISWLRQKYFGSLTSPS